MSKLIHNLTRIVTTGLLLFTGIATAGAAESQLQAGAATSNITPPIGGEIIGGFAPLPSTHIHDELHARCLYLTDGKTELAIVVCDLLGVHRKVSLEARRLITEAIGLPASNVLISATHTHSATNALGENRQHHDPPMSEYQLFVARRIADGVRRAKNNAQPAEIAFDKIDVPEHVNNRRWYMRPGTMPANPFGTLDMVKMNPPAGSPNLEEPAGPVDPQVSIISVRTVDGKPISVYTAYSLHYVGGIGATQVSADYYGYYCERLKELAKADGASSDFVALMANGTSGDVNNVNFRKPRGRQAPFEQIQYVANDIAGKVYALLPKLEYQKDLTLNCRYREPELKYRRLTEKELAWAKDTLANVPDEPGKTNLSLIYAKRAMALAEYPETTPVPLQLFTIGNVAIGTMPCEVFCEIGLEFRERSPIQPAFMVSLSHGYLGYLPTPRHHDLGGYETWLGTNRLEREASVKMLDQLIEMANELKAEQK